MDVSRQLGVLSEFITTRVAELVGHDALVLATAFGANGDWSSRHVVQGGWAAGYRGVAVVRLLDAAHYAAGGGGGRGVFNNTRAGLTQFGK